MLPLILLVGHAALAADPSLPLRVFIDAGHGAPGNPGNDDAACREEQAVMLALADHLAAGLETRGYAVARSRSGEERPSYPERLLAAEAFGAEVLLSLHSDARGSAVAVEVGERSCPQNPSQPGFALLWSDEGDLATDRQALARALAQGMIDQGFLAFDGLDYGTIYQGDAEAPGVFLDRHAPGRRILMLRRPTMPSVILETHHAWHPDEAAAWQDPATWDRLLAAVDQGLQAWRPPPLAEGP